MNLKAHFLIYNGIIN